MKHTYTSPPTGKVVGEWDQFNQLRLPCGERIKVFMALSTGGYHVSLYPSMLIDREPLIPTTLEGAKVAALIVVREKLMQIARSVMAISEGAES